MLQAPLIGFLFGFVGSVPVAGPIAALVLARGLDRKFRSGFFIALGGAIPEGLYAFLAFWGFEKFLSPYPWIDPVCKVVAAIILFGLAIWLMRSPSTDDTPVGTDASDASRKSWFRSFSLGFNITLFNPTLLATWAAAVGILKGTGFDAFGTSNGILFSISAALGIVCWFSAMLWIAKKLQGRFTPSVLEKVRRGFGALLILVALWFAAQALLHFFG